MNEKLTKKLSHSVGKRPDLAKQNQETTKNQTQDGSTLLASAPLLDSNHSILLATKMGQNFKISVISQNNFEERLYPIQLFKVMLAA